MLREITKKINHIHLIGIGGTGMSGIAEVLLNMGYKVSGSDITRTSVTKYLEKIGAKIYYSHKPQNINSADVIVYSNAISEDNPELRFGRIKKIPTLSRIEMLVELSYMKYVISVTGTHGKSTTTSMIGLMLQEAGLDPTILIGGRLKNISSGARLGKGKFLVAELDESNNSFLKVRPLITLVTNIDNDHLDYYKSLNNLKEVFIKHINNVPLYGTSILCIDDNGIKSIISNITKKVITYGIFTNKADFVARDIIMKNFGFSFAVYIKNKYIGSVDLNVPGKHNIQNALGAIACGIELGVPFEKIKSSLQSFCGVSRRIEKKAEINNVVFFDDYGHHPAEIKATITTIKELYPDRKLLVIFQPHRYTRTKILYKQFSTAFKEADVVKLMPIYPANEKPIANVSSELIYKALISDRINVSRFYHPDDIKKVVKEIIPGSVVLTTGAGDVWKICEKLINLWKKMH